ncbi:MAG: dihydroneopterin aldolase [Armatimonadota bacterium]|nr:dihydroneopterin aldolase [Armatimonadota bacterium]
MDKVFVAGLELTAKHGYYDEERQVGNRFRFDVSVSVPTKPAALADDLDRTVDYAQVAKLIKAAADGPSAKLVETLAERIADSVMEKFDAAAAVYVRVAKLDPPLTEGAAEAGVEVTRQRG